VSDARTLTFRTDDGLRLVADAYGDASAPPVLLQHGGGQTRHAWGGTARALAEAGFHAVALDLRGHGESDWSAEADYAFERFARDALQVATALGRPPALVGASLGGISGLVATSLADGPAFSHLVLVDITPKMNREGAEAIVSFMGRNLEEGFQSLDEAADAIARYLPQRPRPKDTSGLRKNLRLGEDGRYRWHWDPKFVNGERPPGRELAATDLESAARALALPTLLVRGRLSELVAEEHAQEFLAMVPHAAYVDVSDAGHMVAGDRNDAFTEAVVGFLAARTGA
jgi:pimeloyl-ACP methyl ester carboxylesterase